MTAPCCDCGAVGSLPHVVGRHGALVAFGHLCDACWTRSLSETDQLRREFEALRESGLSREQANEIMVRRVDSMYAAPVDLDLVAAVLAEQDVVPGLN